MPQDRPGPNPGPFDDLFERLIGNLESTLGDTLGGTTGRRPATGGRTPKLDRFGRDLTADAARGALDPVIGRDAEIDQVLEVLSRRTKNNPVLVGDPGVGKTAIAEGVAQRVADGAVPEALRGVRVVALDLGGMVAGTRYRGDFEQRLTGVIDEVVAAERSIVLFLDELHAVIGAGSAEGAPMDAATLLKPALARGDLRLIGATTMREYRRHIEKDAALERRFEPVPIAEPTVEATIGILRGLRPRYEEHHGVRISDAAIVAAAEMSDRYVPDRFLPDKAIDLLDRASSRARIRAGEPAGPVDSAGNHAGEEELEQLRRAREVAVDAEDFERAHLLTREIEAAEVALGVPAPNLRKDSGSVEIGPDDVARIVSDSTGIPIAQLTGAERRKLLDLEALLHRRVVGQNEAVETVADAVRAGRAGLAHPDRPVGSFLFLGPTGVGKTELARALAEALFGNPDALLRFDMSEFSDRSSAFRLVGAPPGHVGYDDAGQLTEAVRRTRYAVLLLDEIEKANAEVINTLLQVLDAGRLTDSHGRAVDFTHTVVIMTSNLGADRLLAAAGRPVDEVREGVLAIARLHFRPEFLNRIDDIVLFSALDRGELRRITEMLLEGTADRLRAQGVELEATPAAIDWLAERGHQPELGARPLRRTIAREVDRVLSRLIIGGELGPGGRVVADVREGALVLEPQAPGGSASAK
ncbi:ATP-dependent Clp protease ATP-binding subunit [Pseudonocardia sp. DSM 110487]|uniref:ATP-dependent Clp protease ATP-binding subunit n=1 Tax=Pseudonocardia sp. DSM 110487 TaxID=2865833 RepID=UPI001C698CF0|nr:ATP-dependent Clp protease ATP-binding subunit [Pseudonocardia sp. DSM 110487]QYN32268.1 ATP-dependent Clp protease ATP-binding subunit [Pseudonocardia sp. DSM 110487]